DDELDEWQQKMLSQLESGEIGFESTPEREVGLMFMGLDRLAPTFVDEFDWRFLDVPDEMCEVVLPDVGIAMFDPTPRFEGSGTGFASSPNAETALYLSPRL